MGKSFTKLIRLATCLKAIEIAIEALDSIATASLDEITVDFQKACSTAIINLDERALLIGLRTLSRAKKLINYFNMHTIILSGYDIAASSTCEEAFRHLLHKRSEVISPVLSR